MTMTTTSGGSITRAPRPSSLADVLDLILDKGLVIDAYVRVSAVGIELLTIDARIVIASVDTYLHYAEAVNRLDLTHTETKGITGLFGDDDEDADGGDDGHQPGRGDGAGRRSLSKGSGRDRVRDRGDEGDGGDESDEDEDGGDDGNRRGIAARLQERGRWSS